jgi:hypothetical protein
VVKLALTVVAIALADGSNPTLIGGELFVATGAHPRRRTAAFTLAAQLRSLGDVPSPLRSSPATGLGGSQQWPRRSALALRLRQSRGCTSERPELKEATHG